MTRNMKLIWHWGANLFPERINVNINMKILRREIEMLWHYKITLFSYYFLIIFTCWGLRPRPRLGFRAPKCENHMKMIWNRNSMYVSLYFLIIFILFWYVYHISCSGPRFGPPKVLFVFIFLVTFCSYYFHICLYPLAGAPVHSAI